MSRLRRACALAIALMACGASTQAAADQVITLPPGVPAPTCAPAGVTVAGLTLPVCPPDLVTQAGGVASSCDRVDVPVTVTAIRAQPPGGRWQDARGRVCAQFFAVDPGSGPGGADYVTFSLHSLDGVSLSTAYPDGTTYEVSLHAGDGHRPVFTFGGLRDAVVSIDGQDAVIQGKSSAAPQGTEGSCASTPSSFSSTLAFATGGSDIDSLQGAYMNTDASEAGMPFAGPDGSVDELLEGCGDGNPNTADGFFQGFLPTSALTEMGVSNAVLASLTPAATDAVMEMDNNGAAAPDADFAVATAPDVAPTGVKIPTTTGPLGVTFDYQVSYSRHQVRATVNRRALRTARRCATHHGRLHARGRARHRILRCVARRGH